MSGLGKVVRGLLGIVVIVVILATVNSYYGQYKAAQHKSSTAAAKGASGDGSSSADSTGVVPVQGQSVTILAAGVVLHSQPETSTKAISALKKGDVLVLVGVTPSNWLQLRGPKGQIGFVLNNRALVAVKK